MAAETEINLAMGIGVLVLLAGAAAALVALVRLSSRPGKDRALRLVLATAAFAILGFLIGAWLGIEHFCSPVGAGGLCGLGGVFGTGPLGIGVGLLAGAFLMSRARGDAGAKPRSR